MAKGTPPPNHRKPRPHGPLPGVPGGVPRTTGASGELPPTDPRRQAVLKRNWWALASRGVLGVLFGLAAILVGREPFQWLLAGWLALDGALAMLAGLRGARRAEQWGALVTDGLAALFLAGVLLLWPEIPQAAFLWLLIIWALITGVLQLLAGQGLPDHIGRRPASIAGGLSLALGVLLVLTPPMGGDGPRWLLALYGIGLGATMLSWARLLRRGRSGPGKAGR